MAVQGEILICEKCGNVIAVIKEGGNPQIHCCGEVMKKTEVKS